MQSKYKEEKTIVPDLSRAVLQPLPNLLSDEAAWAELQRLLCPAKIAMLDDDIEDPDLVNTRHLPHAWVVDMHNACFWGNVNVIRELVRRDKRLLLTPHRTTGYLPLQQAVLNEASLTVVIELLERHQTGLALASLLHPAASSGQVPLEYALRHGASFAAILKLMAWMGNTLSFDFLTSPLSSERQPILNAILFASVLNGNKGWAEKVIVWGADINAPLHSIMSLLLDVIYHADPRILAAMKNLVFLKIAANSNDQTGLRLDNFKNPIEFLKTISLYQTIRDITITLTHHKIIDFSSLIYMDLSSDEQTVVATPKKRQSSEISVSPIMRHPVISKDEHKTQHATSTFCLFAPPATNESLNDFLQAIVTGEQDKAEQMLQLNAQLALMHGRVIDLSGRTFSNITGFQYALWALDLHMWNMILKYISNDDAIKQYQALETNGTQYGDYFYPAEYIKAINMYIKKSRGWKEPFREEFWCKEVGGLQRLFPAGFVNEFCRLDKTFNPIRNFSDDRLPRTRTIYSATTYGDWFTGIHKGGKLGETFAIYRAGGDNATAAVSTKLLVSYDRNCIYKLSELRLEQRKELLTYLRSPNPRCE